MKIIKGEMYLSASDLSTHIACPHATFLSLQEAKGLLKAPENSSAALFALQQKGEEYEGDYIDELRAGEKTIVEIDRTDRSKAMQATIAAMQAGADIIYQARLEHDTWNGWADFLMKVDFPSDFGRWSYEVMDTKLSRETKAGAILQICLYSEILKELQGCMPVHMHIKNPGGEHQFRVDDFMAYYRLMKSKLMTAIKLQDEHTYPEPVPHCDICKWWAVCNKRRRGDDHLGFIAGIGRSQIKEVKTWEVNTLKSMAELQHGTISKPRKGSVETYRRLAYQANLQLQERTTHTAVFELLTPEAGFGFCNLPEPSPHDIFFDFEGDPFVGTNGLEYLFGWWYQGAYHELWANDDDEERQALHAFMDRVIQIKTNDPRMHIYHFGAYEQTALKRIVGKYASRENDLDWLLRSKTFVNLHSVTRRAIIAGIESYSLKELEKLHGYVRNAALADVGPHKLLYEGLLESGSIDSVDEHTRNVVREYNKDDCISTLHLRDWLELQRAKLLQEGYDIARPLAGEGTPPENVTEHQERIQPLFDALMKDIPGDAESRSPEQQAKWLLANMLDWYRREKKSFWWELFRLRELTDIELLEEKDPLAGLTYTGRREKEKRSFVDYYSFPAQETTLHNSDAVSFKEQKLGAVFSLDMERRIAGVKKSKEATDIHPTHLICSDTIPDKEKEEAIIRLAAWVVDNGIDGDGKCRAGRDLLLRNHPRVNGTLPVKGTAQELALAWVQMLDYGVLPIQGPPGTGKSHTAAGIILHLIKAGKKVGVAALSHKVISALLAKVVSAAREEHVAVRIAQKVAKEEANADDPDFLMLKDNNEVLGSLSGGFHLAAGTSFMWSRENFFEAVDYLFVDEAGQLSLIDTVALSHAAKNLILLGDPQQLKQPQKGSHPEGTEVSALEHILQKDKTIAPHQGVFLDKTWRMHPAINDYISELFYEGRLRPVAGNERQMLLGNTKFNRPGIYFEPVLHYGNQNSSQEEVEVVMQIVSDLLDHEISWIDSRGQRHRLTDGDIKIISPYNAQVNSLKTALPGIQIGTVDKFQGQEAAVIILSSATSTSEDAPRGMEFLYSLNRLNVAVSRAKVVFIMVASPQLLEPECRSPHQMQLANALCRLKEVQVIS